MADESRVVLAIFAHPDDAELTCLGTLAKLSFSGYKVHILNLTAGENSSTYQPGTREKEMVSVSKLIGCSVSLESLSDGSVPYNKETVSLIERYIYQLSPHIVITHYPQISGYDHQDHAAVSAATINAARRIPSIKWILYAEPTTQNFDFIPNLFVDITDYMNLKKQAIGLYQSEGTKSFMSPQVAEIRARWWALQACFNDLNRTHFYEALIVVKGVIDQGFF